MKKLKLKDIKWIQESIKKCDVSVNRAFFIEDDDFREDFSRLIILTKSWELPKYDILKENLVFEVDIYNVFKNDDFYDFDKKEWKAEWVKELIEKEKSKTYHFFKNWLDDIKNKWNEVIPEIQAEVKEIAYTIDKFNFNEPDLKLKEDIESFFRKRWNKKFNLKNEKSLEFARFLIYGIDY